MPDVHGITRRGLVGGAALLTATPLIGALPAFSQAGAGTVKLRVLETTDVHVHILSYDYYRDGPDNTVGLAKIATLVERERASARNTLLFDNGDFLQGNPLGDLVALETGIKAGTVHPMIRAFNLLNYDAATLGNHEFNYGLDFLDLSMSGLSFPVVCANVAKGRLAANARADQMYVKPYVILDRQVVDESGASHTIKVGVIGVTPPQIMQWDEKHLAGKLEARDMVDAVAAFVPEMRERGADLVVVLAHTGIAVQPKGDRDENAAFHIAQVPGVDVVLTGHQHQVFPGPTFQRMTGVDAQKGTIGGVPTVMAGFWGSHLGRIDLTLAKDGNRFRVTSHETTTLPIFNRADGRVVPTVEANQRMIAAVAVEHEQTLAYVRRPVGSTTVPLHSYFALVRDSAVMRIISDAQLWYGRALLAQSPHKDLPLLSAVAPFRAGGRGGPANYTDVPAGQIALKNVADIYVFPNTVKIVRVTGTELQAWLERSAGIFNQIKAGDGEQALIDGAFPAFNFDIIHGVTYRIDVSQPSRFDVQGNEVNPTARRIVDLAYNGRPVQPTDAFAIVSNNYRATGGGRFPGAVARNIIIDAPDYSRDVVARYLTQAGAVSPRPFDNWSLAAVPGATRVVFETGPKARDLLSEAPNLTPAGDGANGFAKFLVRLGA